MIVLDATTKTLEVILAGAITTNQLPFVVTYVELDSTLAVSAIGETDGVTNNSSAVTMLSAPASGKIRQVKHVTIPNVDTAAATVTVRINNNGTFRQMVTMTLSTGDNLVYTE